MMASIVSVDLAYKRYQDLGIAVLATLGEEVQVDFVKGHSIGLQGEPSPLHLAQALSRLCEIREAPVLMLDGPQAWKHPDNGLEHSRLCDRIANAPAKVGLPGQAKPASYASFVRFSIEVYLALQRLGARLLLSHYDQPAQSLVVLESLPLSAWRSLGIAPLPSKKKAQEEDLRDRVQQLRRLYRLKLAEAPTHDEVQAVVAGLGGLAFSRGAPEEYEAVGSPPRMFQGYLREGFIVNPKKPRVRPDS